ncbi:MAG: hypothetical protein WCL16_04945, partial [bacterium]
MKQLTKSTVVTLFLAVGCILPQFLWAATATNRQAAGTTDYWTNNAIWTASPYPGSGPNESAYLTTNMAGSYTNVLNATLANSISNIVISNSLGTAWLVITNAVVTNAAMFVRNGGRLRIDNGGSLMSSGAMDRTDCRLYINSGGAFYQTTNTSSYFNLGYGTMSNAQMVLIGGTVPAVYDGGSNRLNVGQSGSAASLLLVDGNGVTGGAVVTNVSTSQTGRDSQFNTTVLTNGGLMLMKAGSFTVGQSGTLPSSSNVLIVVGNPAVSVLNMMGGDFVVGAGNNTLTLVSRGNSAIFDGGGLAGGAVLTNANNVTVGSDGSNYADLQGNRLVVTNGGSLFSSGTVTIGNVATNVSYIIDGGAVGSVVSNRAITIGTGLSRFARMSVANARLQSGGAVTLGSASSSNTIAVLSGALWDGLSQAFTIGSGAAMNNVMTVDGGGGAGSAVLTNVGTMTISSHATGVGNALIITNGARFFSGAVTLGNVGAASNNSYIVAGSTATNALITVGGFWNQMRVANSTIASAGLTLGGISNTVTVDPASVWNFSGSPLTINVNTGVALTVNSGAVVTNVGGISLSGVQQACYLTNAGSAKNIFLGTRGYLYVGGTANTSSGLHSNNLVLANQTFTGTVGGYNWIGINSSFNTLTLLSNTLWNANAEDLVIGNGYSASFVGASNNLVVVDGGGVTGGAVITNLNSIRVGWAGGAAANTGIAANNRMVITNGGCVSVAGVGYIGAGQFTNAIGNSVLV